MSIFLISLALVALLSSCISVGTNFATTAILGYNNEAQAESLKTLDPSVSYSQRAGILMKFLGDEKKQQELLKKFPNAVSHFLNAERDGVAELEIPTSDGSRMKVFLVYPTSFKYKSTKKEKYPVILFAHGGGFTAQDFSVYEKLTRKLSNATQTVILFFEYRLAPEFKFPTQVNDQLDAYNWLVNEENASLYHLDRDNIMLFGDSSGGNLAEGLCIRLAEEERTEGVRAVILTYPSLDVSDRMNYSRTVFSGLEDENRYYVTPLKYLAFVMDAYLENKEDAYKPYASPLIMMEGLLELPGYTNDNAKYKPKLNLPLDTYPEHFILVPEVDALRDEGKMYNALLNIYGAKSSIKEYSGMFHGFLMTFDFLNGSRRAFDDIVAFINERFSDRFEREKLERTTTETLVTTAVPVE